MAKKEYSLAHTKWMCKYHIVFTPKYRRKVIYNQYKEDIRDIIKQLCSYKGVEIIEGHLMPDHIHMLVSIPPKISVSSFMGYLKGKSALMIFDKHANLKYKFGNRHFWAEGYYVSTVGLNEATIKKYIQEQEKHDIAMDKFAFGVIIMASPFILPLFMRVGSLNLNFLSMFSPYLVYGGIVLIDFAILAISASLSIKIYDKADLA